MCNNVTGTQSDEHASFNISTVLIANVHGLHMNTHRWIAGDTQEAEGRHPGQEMVAGRFH